MNYLKIHKTLIFEHKILLIFLIFLNFLFFGCKGDYIKINLISDDQCYTIKIAKGTFLNSNQLDFKSDNIISLYYDSNFQKPYNKEILKEDFILYIQFKPVSVYIKEIFANEININSSYKSITASDVYIKYYLGNYGEAYCAVIKNDIPQICEALESYTIKTEVQDFEFNYLPEKISVFYNYKYYNIIEAYNIKILNSLDIQKIYNYCIKYIYPERN